MHSSWPNAAVKMAEQELAEFRGSVTTPEWALTKLIESTTRTGIDSMMWESIDATTRVERA